MFMFTAELNTKTNQASVRKCWVEEEARRGKFQAETAALEP